VLRVAASWARSARGAADGAVTPPGGAGPSRTPSPPSGGGAAAGGNAYAQWKDAEARRKAAEAESERILRTERAADAAWRQRVTGAGLTQQRVGRRSSHFAMRFA
jgi:hypothetical protein